MTFVGWMIMSVSVSSVMLLVVFCLVRVLAMPPRDITEHLKGLPEIDTRDTQDAD